MKLVASGKRFRVIDDFLSSEALEQARLLMEKKEFEEVTSVVDPEADGSAFRSRSFVLRHDAASAAAEAQGTNTLPVPYKSVVQELHSHVDMFGVPGEDWSIVGLSFWRYAAGNRLGWHNDVASGRRGEFIFFLHDEWRASWAGELLLLDVDPESVQLSDPGMSPLAKVEAKVSLASHTLTAIVPKPNRLVLVKEGTIHCIQRVDRTVGAALRKTMTGFIASNLPEKKRESNNIDRLASLLGKD